MKFLHTADWHVGRALRGRSRADEHVAVLAEIAAVAEREQVDAVLVVGDLFDTAAPTAESERIVYRALLDLAATGATVVVVAGNHDSDRRLQAVAPLLELGRVVTRPVFASAADGGVVEVHSRDGQERALVACVPFLSQRWVVRAADLVDRGAAEQQLQYAERMRMVIGALTSAFTDPATVHVLASHCMVLGAETVGSERSGQTVFEYAVSANAFPSVLQYVALGHLHRQQVVAAGVPTYYSGSPLALDFGEVDDTKGVLLVEAAAGRPARVRPVPLTAGRRLRQVEGTVDELARRAPDLADAWVKAVVLDAPRAGLADEVRAVLASAVDVVVPRQLATPPTVERRAGRSPQELFAQYLADRGIEDPRLTALFAALLDDTLAGIP